LDKPSEFVKEYAKKVTDFIKDDTILHFFMNDIDKLLDSYQPGRPENKPDVVKQIDSLTKNRQQMETQMQQMQQQMQAQMQQQLQQAKMQYESRIAQLTAENLTLKDKTEYLTKKMSDLIQKQIEQKKSFDETYGRCNLNKIT
jgi:predicted  nucleic acid-binding Zn-ribbon protein